MTAHTYYSEQIQLSKLQQQCGDYVHDIKKMKMFVYKKYDTFCIAEERNRQIDDESGGYSIYESQGYSQLLGDFEVDPAMEVMQQLASVWLCISGASLSLILVVALVTKRRQQCAMVASVDQDALLAS